MRLARLLFLFVFSLFQLFPSAARQIQAPTAPPQRDPRALAILHRALSAQGGNVPADSVAAGTVSIVEGSTREQGTIRILTRGTDQSAELIQLPSGNRSVMFSRLQITEKQGPSTKASSMELAVTSQCPDFPLPLLAASMGNPDFAFQYIGAETLEGTSAIHIKAWNTFASQPDLQELATVSSRDIWIDANTGFVSKISYIRRQARGASPGIPVEVSFSDYRDVGGIKYPFLIQKSYNGTPWETITIAHVSVGAGLTDADFPVEQGVGR